MINKHTEHIKHLEALLRAVDNGEIGLDLLFPLKDSASDGGDDEGDEDEDMDADEDALREEEEAEQQPEEQQGPYDLQSWQNLSFREKVEAYVKNRAPDAINWEGAVLFPALSHVFVV